MNRLVLLWRVLTNRFHRGAVVSHGIAHPPVTPQEAKEHIAAAIVEADAYHADTALVSTDVLRHYIVPKKD